MSKLLSFLIGLAIWLAWGFAASAAGLSAQQGASYWLLWGVTLILAVWYGNKHHFEQKEE